MELPQQFWTHSSDRGWSTTSIREGDLVHCEVFVDQGVTVAFSRDGKPLFISTPSEIFGVDEKIFVPHKAATIRWFLCKLNTWLKPHGLQVELLRQFSGMNRRLNTPTFHVISRRR